MGIRTKVIISLAFVLLVIFLFLFNKATLNDLIPVDYIEDPWPFKKSCDVTPPPSE